MNSIPPSSTSSSRSEYDDRSDEQLPNRPSAEQIMAMLEVLDQIAADRGVLAVLDREQRDRLLRTIGQIASPSRSERRKLTREFRRQRKQKLAEKKQADDEKLEQTGIRAQSHQKRFPTPEVSRPSRRSLCRSAPPEPFEERLPPPATIDEDTFPIRLTVPRNCYTCKRYYDRAHFFYDSLCPDCATLNWQKRNQTCDLTGRFALVTGGRVKIGYQAVIKLLRAGADVVVTTRFPRDAARRFLQEEDSSDWINRLQIHGIDLRHTPSIEAFADHLVATLPRLDFILNNACQTVRRPPGFYAHLIHAEQAYGSLDENESRLLQSYRQLCRKPRSESENMPTEVVRSIAGIRRAAELTQVPLTDDDHLDVKQYFPTGEYDQDEQQIDLRKTNSWRLRLAEVPTVELLEVHLVNAVAPFLLNSRLKPLMTRVASHDKHIVNVSAMEGVFYRAYKTDKHPHTNMAKAALNMLTRTSAQDYIRDGIHMNSVDTGWITDEDPAEIAVRKREELRFRPPLDIVDAAARICDPIFSGFLTGNHVWGKFLKDYRTANW